MVPSKCQTIRLANRSHAVALNALTMHMHPYPYPNPKVLTRGSRYVSPKAFPHYHRNGLGMTQQEEPEIFELLRKIRYDATAIQAKVTDALNMLANMNLPAARTPTHVCRICGAGFHGERALAFHDANVHDGPPVPLTDEEIAA